MARGTVKWFDPNRGYGFIRPEQGEDVFVHLSAVQASGLETLQEGQAVEFDIEQGRKGLQPPTCGHGRHARRDDAPPPPATQGERCDRQTGEPRRPRGVRIPRRCTSTSRSATAVSRYRLPPPRTRQTGSGQRGRRMPRGRGRDRTGRRPTAPVPGPMTGPTVGRCAQGGRGAPTNRGKPEIPRWRCHETRTSGEHSGDAGRTVLGGSTDPVSRYVLGAAELILPAAAPLGDQALRDGPEYIPLPWPSHESYRPSTSSQPEEPRPLTPSVPARRRATGERSVSGWWLA